MGPVNAGGFRVFCLPRYLLDLDSHTNGDGWLGFSALAELVEIGGVSGKLTMSLCGSGILFPMLVSHGPYGCKCCEKVACHLSLRKYLDSLGKS